MVDTEWVKICLVSGHSRTHYASESTAQILLLVTML